MSTTVPRSSTALADARIPVNHPFAAHLARAAAAERRAAHRAWTPDDGPLPSLYLSHGAPMLFEMTDWMTQLHTWARDLPRPRAILIVSAHWESAPLSLSATAPSELVYDFGGFDPMYFQMRYDTPVATGLAATVAAMMPDAEPVHEHRSRGLDHGAWVPLKIMYPEADVPVLQLSMPTHDPARLLDLGRRLRGLREEGVLVVGSGYMTHGLPHLDWSRPDQVPGWSSDFDLWAADALARGDVDSLSDFRHQAPGMPYAHPTVEHFTPLFVTLGASADPGAAPTTTIDGYAIGLAKRSFQSA
ncbi:dioxygenase [Nocardioides dongxiaopingii]|uniref:dioxygenase family protein n=1 Tax=Nocardioides sp. S-1144 TaxID=2582905 RepID=UPI00110F5F17|nr:class III extradiol ring-cleavage dioxygenase [Nocardioides sp. S-1144]QCW49359.1 dioxygenase [Nocardioides sp. S-1144]